MTTVLCLKDVLLDSAKEVFETMVFMSLEESEAGLSEETEVALLGTITFTGALEGYLTVCCGMPCAQTISAGMLCMDSPDELSDDDVIDAMGEICNMVMGSVKTRVQDHVEGLTISIPSVVEGHKLRSRQTEDATRVEVNANLAGEHRAAFALVYRETGGAGSEG